MGQIIITTTSEQEKAVNAVVMDAQEWLQLAWDGKANKCMERILIKKSDKNVDRLDEAGKKSEFNSLTLKTRKEIESEAIAAGKPSADYKDLNI